MSEMDFFVDLLNKFDEARLASSRIIPWKFNSAGGSSSLPSAKKISYSQSKLKDYKLNDCYVDISACYDDDFYGYGDWGLTAPLVFHGNNLEEESLYVSHYEEFFNRVCEKNSAGSSSSPSAKKIRQNIYSEATCQGEKLDFPLSYNNVEHFGYAYVSAAFGNIWGIPPTLHPERTHEDERRYVEELQIKSRKDIAAKKIMQNQDEEEIQSRAEQQQCMASLEVSRGLSFQSPFCFVDIAGYFINSSGYGGYGAIIRQRAGGKVIVAASRVSEHPVSPLYVKLQGVKLGLELAIAHKCFEVAVCTSSMYVASVAGDRRPVIYHDRAGKTPFVRNIMDEIRELRRSLTSFDVGLIHRRKNQAAVYLANLVKQMTVVPDEFPEVLRSIVDEDANGGRFRYLK